MSEIETQVRAAIRDAVNRKSRKPFYWGGLKGYEQLEAIAQALAEVPCDEPETGYLRRLKMQVERAVEAYRVNVEDLREAHTWLRNIADCLRYPPSDATPEPSLTSEQVRQEMEELLQSFKPDLKRRPAQAALYAVWHRTWQEYGSDLLHCYDVPGLPPDNLMLEALFGMNGRIKVTHLAAKVIIEKWPTQASSGMLRASVFPPPVYWRKGDDHRGTERTDPSRVRHRRKEHPSDPT